MADAALGTERSKLPPHPLRPTGLWRDVLTSVLTFVALLLVIGLAWEGIKAVFGVADYNLPHIADIFGALAQPAQRGGAPLINYLSGAALFTLGEAALGFAAGGLFGFALAVLFAHSGLLERGLMPYVIASQTVPILAVAPMIVIGLSNLGAPRWLSVAVIASYLSFFPITINTLRGLISTPSAALDLMRSYAATPWQVLWRLRVPHALPYIFTALKVSATGSIVGAIIGELPSSMTDGLGYAILNFNNTYNSAPPRLWATIVIAAVLGIGAFVLVSAAERLALRGSPPDRSLA